MKQRFPYGRILVALASFWAFGSAAFAQDAASTNQPARNYNRRVEMHETPILARVPERKPDDDPSMAEQLNLEPHPEDAAIPMEQILSYMAQPRTPVRNKRDSQKPKNWITMSTEDGKDAKDKKETKKSGWGWLADDVLNRQKEDADEKEEKDGEEQEEGRITILPSDRLLGSDTKTVGLILDNTHTPVSSSLLRESEKRDVMDTVDLNDAETPKSPEARRESERAEESAVANVPTTGERQALPSDSVWNSDAVWNRDARTEPLLARTRQVLSTPAMLQPAQGNALPAGRSDFGSPLLTPTRSTVTEPARRTDGIGIGSAPRSQGIFTSVGSPGGPSGGSAIAPIFGQNYLQPLPSSTPQSQPSTPPARSTLPALPVNTWNR